MAADFQSSLTSVVGDAGAFPQLWRTLVSGDVGELFCFLSALGLVPGAARLAL